MIAAGQAFWLAMVTGTNLLLFVFVAISLRITEPAPAPVVARGAHRRIVAQTVLILAVILLTAISGLLPSGVPGWSQLVEALQSFGERTLPVELVGGPGNAVANPVQYFVIPFVLLLLMGARPAELGFGKGYRSWRVTLAWVALPAVTFAALLIAGLLPLQVLVRRLIGNSLQNGFFEEFLFRGALQTRLNGLVTPAWALVAQALVFGVWHVHSNTLQFGGDVLAGLAACIVSQAIFGLCFGIVFNRTRNLLAPSVAHVMVNTLAQTIG